LPSDSPRTDTASAPGSAPGQQSSSCASQCPPVDSARSSTPVVTESSAPSAGAVPQTDPGGGDAPPTGADGFGGGEILPSGSATDGDLVAAPAASPPSRPTTRLQQGITKPKIYTDGTVRWCNLATSSTDEPLRLLMLYTTRSGLRP
jgi:hypothetical protein